MFSVLASDKSTPQGKPIPPSPSDNEARAEIAITKRTSILPEEVASLENVTLSLSQRIEGSAVKGDSTTTSAATSLSLAQQLHVIDTTEKSAPLPPPSPPPYLTQLAAWQNQALQSAKSRKEKEGINQAVLIIKRHVENNRFDAPLILKNLHLRSLPPLPTDLLILDVSDNFLNTVPPLPKTLLQFSVANNHIRTLSEPLPSNLQALDVHNNQLNCLPPLPTKLERLNISHNRLVTLTEVLPKTSLKIFLLEYNPLTSLPETITTLHPDCTVHLRGLSLPHSVIVRLREIVSAPDYRGPTFYVEQEVSSHTAQQSLSDAASLWYEAQQKTQAQSKWAKFDNVSGANDFSAFLDRLRSSIHFSLPKFRNELSAWLDQLLDDKQLRTLVFAIAKEALGSCEDRATLTLNAMHYAQINLDIERGKYDTRLNKLIALGRQMFRLNELEKIARTKTASLRLIDEVEVYLAYQTKLHQALDLPVTATQMRFFDVSSVTQDDLDVALIMVQQREEKYFFSYLANEWGPWQILLKHLAPQAYAQAEEELSAAADSDFFERQQAWLASHGLANTEFHRTQTSAMILKEITDQIKEKLTRTFLNERGISFN